MTNPMKMLDPVCEMVVDVTTARDQGLTIQQGEREYAFCAHACLLTFAKSPQQYIPKVDAWLAARARGEHADKRAHAEELPVIDNGLRQWYASCRCCLSERYPQVVEVLDAEKAQAGH